VNCERFDLGNASTDERVTVPSTTHGYAYGIKGRLNQAFPASNRKAEEGRSRQRRIDPDPVMRVGVDSLIGTRAAGRMAVRPTPSLAKGPVRRISLALQNRPIK
jgi:hypothetical protein